MSESPPLQQLLGQNKIMQIFQQNGLNNQDLYSQMQIVNVLNKLVIHFIINILFKSSKEFDVQTANEIFSQIPQDQFSRYRIDQVAQTFIKAELNLIKGIKTNKQEYDLLNNEYQRITQKIKDEETLKKNQLNAKVQPNRSNIIIVKLKDLLDLNQNVSECYCTIQFDQQNFTASSKLSDNPKFDYTAKFEINQDSAINFKIFVKESIDPILYGVTKLYTKDLLKNQKQFHKLEIKDSRGGIQNATLFLETFISLDKLSLMKFEINEVALELNDKIQTLNQYTDQLEEIRKPFGVGDNLASSYIKSFVVESSINPSQVQIYNGNFGNVQPGNSGNPGNPGNSGNPQLVNTNGTNINVNGNGNKNVIVVNDIKEAPQVIYYSFLLFQVYGIFAIFTCFTIPYSFLNIILFQLQMIMIINDYFTEKYIKILIGAHLITLLLFLVYLFHNLQLKWDQLDVFDDLMIVAYFMLLFAHILVPVALYFFFYTSSQRRERLLIRFWQFEFQIGIKQENLFQ